MGISKSKKLPVPVKRRDPDDLFIDCGWLFDQLPPDLQFQFYYKYPSQARLKVYFQETSNIEPQHDSLVMRCLFIAYTISYNKDLSKLTIADKPYGVNSQAIDLLTAILSGVICHNIDILDQYIDGALRPQDNIFDSYICGNPWPQQRRSSSDLEKSDLFTQWQEEEYVKNNINLIFFHLFDLFATPSREEINCYRDNGLLDSVFIEYLALLPPGEIKKAMGFYRESGLLTLASVLDSHETGYHCPPILALCMCGYSTYISKRFFGSYKEDLKTQVRRFFSYILNPDSEEQPDAQPMVLSALWPENDESIQNKQFYNRFKLAVLPRLKLLNRIWSCYLLNKAQHENHKGRFTDVMAKLKGYYRNSNDWSTTYIILVIDKVISENVVNGLMSDNDVPTEKTLLPVAEGGANCGDANTQGSSSQTPQALDTHGGAPSAEPFFSRALCFGSCFFGKCFQPSSAQSPCSEIGSPLLPPNA